MKLSPEAESLLVDPLLLSWQTPSVGPYFFFCWLLCGSLGADAP